MTRWYMPSSRKPKTSETEQSGLRATGVALLPMMDNAYGAPGELLFHYTRAATAFEYILPDKKIRLNPYKKMRDHSEHHRHLRPGEVRGRRNCPRIR